MTLKVFSLHMTEDNLDSRDSVNVICKSAFRVISQHLTEITAGETADVHVAAKKRCGLSESLAFLRRLAVSRKDKQDSD